MSEKTNPTPPPVCCPFCGGQAEPGHLLASQILQWVRGDYEFWKDMASGFGTRDLMSLVGLGGRAGTMSPAGHVYLSGVRCEACPRMVLDIPAGGFDYQAVKQAGGSEAP